jgi:hypothetical protein
MTQRRFVRGLPTRALLIPVVFAVAGCTGTSTPSALAPLINVSLPPIPTDAPTDSPTAAQSNAATEAPSGSELPSAVATNIDPCQLVTSADASQLVGVTFGAGKEIDTKGNVKGCTYAAPGPNLFSVFVAIAPDVATAQAAKAGAEQSLKESAATMANGKLTVTDLPSFAPGTDATTVQGSMTANGISLGAQAIYLLRGTTFLGMSDLSLGGAAPPSDQAMQDKATQVLANLP